MVDSELECFVDEVGYGIHSLGGTEAPDVDLLTEAESLLMDLIDDP